MSTCSMSTRTSASSSTRSIRGIRLTPPREWRDAPKRKSLLTVPTLLSAGRKERPPTVQGDGRAAIRLWETLHFAKNAAAQDVAATKGYARQARAGNASVRRRLGQPAPVSVKDHAD